MAERVSVRAISNEEGSDDGRRDSVAI